MAWGEIPGGISGQLEALVGRIGCAATRESFNGKCWGQVADVQSQNKAHPATLSSSFSVAMFSEEIELEIRSS